MRKGWIFFAAFIFGLNLNAQETTVTATHTIGIVEYFKQTGAPAQHVFPGMKMELSGSLRCKSNASVKLLYRGVAFENNSNKLMTLAELVGSVNTEGQADFTGRFWNFIHKSVEETDSEEKLKANHQSFMERTRGSKKGLGSHGYVISAIPLASGVLPLDVITFKWRKPADQAACVLEIRSTEGERLVYVQARDTIVSLDLRQMALQSAREYEWVVAQSDSSTSAVLTFKLAPDIIQKADSKLKEDKGYQSASLEERQLMRAYYFEEAQCYYLADETYSALMAASPENKFIRMIYAAFLSRMDMLPEGQRLIRQ